MAHGFSNAPGATYPEVKAVEQVAKAAQAAATGGEDQQYSNAKTYAVGDYCNKDGKLYKCIVAITTPEEWTAAHWEETTVTEELKAIQAAAEAAMDAATGGEDQEYSNAKTYAVGDYCNKDGKLYKCIVAITTPEEWTPAHWSETTLTDEIKSAIEGGGSGGGNVIKVTFGAEFIGKEYIVTDGAGEEKTGTVPSSRVVNVSVTGCNTTYTIKSTVDGVEYSNTVTTGPYYGQYTAVLNVFSAIINVNTAPGAVATATADGLSFSATANSSGVAAIVVKKAATYAVTATKGGKTSSDDTAIVTTDGSTVTATVKFTISNVPSQAGSPTYTGEEITAEWNDYNTEELTIGGTTKATNAVTSTASFTPKTGFQWPDGTITAKSVNWTINPANGSLSIIPTTMALTGSSPTGTIIATRAGDGAVSASSSNTDVATVDVDGTVITVQGVSDGTANINVTVGAGTNHKAVTVPVTCAVTATDMVHIYGASWDGTSTTRWTRTDEAAGFTDPVPAINNGNGSSPFDGKMPWSGMQKSERTGGTMVSIPKFWYKLTQNGNGIKVQIADKAQAGYSVSPAHMDRGDGKGERDVVYVGRYHCHTSDYKSKTGGKPKASITRSAARTAIHNLGANIWQADFAMRFTIWLLYIVEFADWNSQAKIGKGCGNSSGTENMGYTDSMTYHTGTKLSSRDTYGLGTQYRWIEGLWDNVLDWCDGCYYNSNGLNIIKNPANFSDTANGTLAGKPSSGYPSKFTVTSNGGFPIFYPTEASGSETTYSCDNWDFDASYPCLCVGGSYGQYGNLGLFCVSCSAASGTGANIGARLQELP